MGIMSKIRHKGEEIYRNRIVCEQYPMLSSTSRKEWQSKNAIGLVYMLHHITDKNPQGIPTNEDLKVSPHFLEHIIIKYRKKGFRFISLDKLSEIITSDTNSEEPFIAFTIDDGYLDNYTQALPVFERQHVPFTIFIATDFIDRKAILWWDILEEIVLHNNSIKIGSNEYRCGTFQEKWNVFRILREIILLFDHTKLNLSLIEFFSNYNIDWYEPVSRQAMSWEQVKEISKHPLCTIGGHTVSHVPLNNLDEEEFHHEVSDGIAKLEKYIGKPILHFAYPYGSPNEIGEREFKLISDFGFKTVFTAHGGCITESNKHQITHLPRVYLHE